MIPVYIQCTNCGFQGRTYENEDLTEDEEILMEEETEECPQCGEYVEEIDDDEIIQHIDEQIEDNQLKREIARSPVVPFTLGESDDGD